MSRFVTAVQTSGWGSISCSWLLSPASCSLFWIHSWFISWCLPKSLIIFLPWPPAIWKLSARQSYHKYIIIVCFYFSVSLMTQTSMAQIFWWSEFGFNHILGNGTYILILQDDKVPRYSWCISICRVADEIHFGNSLSVSWNLYNFPLYFINIIKLSNPYGFNILIILILFHSHPWEWRL